MGRFTYNQLKNKSLEEIQKLYEREHKWIINFVPIDSEMVKDSGKKDDDCQKQAESSKKRPRAEHDKESVKKQKLEDDAEKEELRACLDIVSRDDIVINVESLATKYLIVDWKTHILTKNMMYYQIIRVDGSSKNYKIISEMLDDFDRQVMVDLYRSVKKGSTSFDESDDEDYIFIYDKIVFSYKLVSVNDLKTDSENGIDEVSIPPNDVVIKQIDNDIDYNVDTQSYKFEEDFETNHDIHSEPSNMEDYLIIIKVEMALSMDARLSMEHTDVQGHIVFTSHAWRRLFEIRGPLVREMMMEFFSTCRFADTKLDLGNADKSSRVIASKGDLKGYWDEISSSRDFLTTIPFYIQIRDPLRRLCHRLSAHTIAGRGQAPEKGATVVVRELTEIDLDELSRLHIYKSMADTWAWVSPRLKRQHVNAAGALEDVKGAPTIDEGV
ncbi:hypothetical protein Tco_0617152 [Tanacetum coccineum]